MPFTPSLIIADEGRVKAHRAGCEDDCSFLWQACLRVTQMPRRYRRVDVIAYTARGDFGAEPEID